MNATPSGQDVLPSHASTIASTVADTVRTIATVQDWLSHYISRPHDHLGRTGAICPFVAPSRRAGSLEIVVRRLGPDADPARFTALLHAGMAEFGQVRWRGSNPSLRSLIIVVPDLDETGCQRLDEAHRLVKPVAVRRGLMLGQFHPYCAEPAARNPGFPVSRSPIPLFVVRAMALHDVLFLHDRPDWFAEYRLRFGRHYEPGRSTVEPLFAQLFHAACARHGSTP